MKKLNFRERIEAIVREQEKPEYLRNLKNQAAVRKRILGAIKKAQEALGGMGYHMAIVRDTGSMISAKMFLPSPERNYQKALPGLNEEWGYTFNFQIGGSDPTFKIYSYRNGSNGVEIVASSKPQEIENAVMTELESQIKAGVEFLKKHPNRPIYVA